MATLNGSRQALSQEQVQLLADEVKKPEHKKVTPGGICKALNFKRLIENPTPQGEIDSPEISLSNAFGRLTVDEYLSLRTSDIGQSALQAIIAFPDADLSCTLAVGLKQKIVDEGLLSAERMAELFASGKTPDPNWQAQIYAQSRTEELLGDGWKVEGEDIRMVQVK